MYVNLEYKIDFVDGDREYESAEFLNNSWCDLFKNRLTNHDMK